MYLVIALIFCACNCGVKSCNLQSKPLELFNYNSRYNGYKCYGDSFLFEKSRPNLLHCATDCANVDACVWFSYDKSSKTCIGCLGPSSYLTFGASKAFVVDWIPYAEHHGFRVSNWEMNFNTAKEYCECLGATIARLDSAEKVDFIKTISWDHVSVWIGLTDEGHEGVWTWVHGGDEATFTDWKIGDTSTQPNGGEEQNCAAISKGYGYRWADRKCSLKSRVICEKPILAA